MQIPKYNPSGEEKLKKKKKKQTHTLSTPRKKKKKSGTIFPHLRISKQHTKCTQYN